MDRAFGMHGRDEKCILLGGLAIDDRIQWIFKEVDCEVLDQVRLA